MFKKKEKKYRWGAKDRDSDAPLLVLYVCPYYKVAFPNLDQIPSNVEQALIAFGGPDNNSTATVAYIYSSGRTPDEIKERIKTVKANGTVIGLSIIDNPSNQWPQVNKYTFAQNLKAKADELGIDYVFNIDAESSSASAQDYIDLILNIRKVMPNAVINYVTYSASDIDRTVLSSSAADELQLLMTMSYADSLQALQDEYRSYRAMNANIPIATGVKQGAVSEDVIRQMTQWARPDGMTRRMMLWNANRQGAAYGNPGPAFGIYDMMYQSLHTPVADELMSDMKNKLESLERLLATPEMPQSSGLSDEYLTYGSASFDEVSKNLDRLIWMFDPKGGAKRRAVHEEPECLEALKKLSL